MKTKFLTLFSLMLVLSSCGKKDEPAAATTVAPVTTCADPSMVWGPNGCAPTMAGYPPGGSYSGYNNLPPVTVVVPPSNCGGYNGGYYGGYGRPYCQSPNRYRWAYSGGYYWYFSF